MERTDDRRVRIAVSLLMFFVLMAAVVSAQTLDNKWFKVNIVAKTFKVDPDTGLSKPYNFRVTVYMYLEYVGVGYSPRGSIYDYEFWCKNETGAWVKYDDSQIHTAPQSENFFRDLSLRFGLPGGGFFDTRMTALISANPKKFKGGGEIYNGYDANDFSVLGWQTATGTLVTKLPFTPTSE
jgi:hypothetical protein